MNTIVTTYMNLARLIYMNLNSQTLYMNCNSNMNESNRYMNKFTASQIYIWMYTLHMNLSTRIYIWIGISRHWNMNFSETYIWIIYCSINKCMNVNEAYINILLKWILLQNGNHTHEKNDVSTKPNVSTNWNSNRTWTLLNWTWTNVDWLINRKYI